MKDCSNCGYCSKGMESDEHGSVYFCDLKKKTYHPHLITDEWFMDNCKSWISKGQQILLEGKK